LLQCLAPAIGKKLQFQCIDRFA